MATIEALQPRLRQLKLSGMVDSIAARVQEARARPLDPLDFLLLLLEDELMRRESAHYGEFVQWERRKANGEFGVKRTVVSAMPSRLEQRWCVEAMSMVGVQSAGPDHLLCHHRSRTK